jgi:phosphoribosylamine--glycine ligase
LRDSRAIANYAWEKRVDLVVVGPEEPLVFGVADELASRGIPSVGPKKDLAQIEGNKSLLRQVTAKYAGSANPRYRVCRTREEVRKALAELGEVAVKPLGLTGGKGVRVMGKQLRSSLLAEEYAVELIDRDGQVLLEERLLGEEFSQMIFTDGLRIVPIPLVQDAKYAYEDDLGLMTGGMGSYSIADHYLPFLPQSEREKSLHILERILNGIQEEMSERYHGVLYGQFMLTLSGPIIVEINTRFGDPEAINVLAILRTDPVDVFMGMICGLPEEIKFDPQATVCKYLVPDGYPDLVNENILVRIDERVFRDEQTDLIFGGAERRGGNICSTGSRFGAVLAIRPTLESAERAVEKTITRLGIKGLRHRRDIATAASIQKKQEKMQLLLSGNISDTGKIP